MQEQNAFVKKDYISNLPRDILKLIIAYTNLKKLLPLRLLSKEFLNFINVMLGDKTLFFKNLRLEGAPINVPYTMLEKMELVTPKLNFTKLLTSFYIANTPQIKLFLQLEDLLDYRRTLNRAPLRGSESRPIFSMRYKVSFFDLPKKIKRCQVDIDGKEKVIHYLEVNREECQVTSAHYPYRYERINGIESTSTTWPKINAEKLKKAEEEDSFLRCRIM